MIQDLGGQQKYRITASSLERGCRRLEPLQRVTYGATGFDRQNRPQAFSISPVENETYWYDDELSSLLYAQCSKQPLSN
jgi:hypothetical protein